MKAKTIMSTLLLSLSVGAVIPQSNALPINDDFFALVDVAALSEYRSRGISQTLGDPALQGSILLGHTNGLYVGVWSSNVDFGYDTSGRQEVDYYAGWFWQFSEKLSVDLGYIKYDYPKQSEFNQSEVYAILSAYSFQVAANYSTDAQNVHGKNQDTLYSWVGYETQLPRDIGLMLRYGRMDFKDPTYFSAGGGARDHHMEWEAKVTRDIVGATWGISYVDTDLSKTECFNTYGFDDVCSPALVASVSKTF